MGTWGVGSFDNDAALDWVYDFAEARDRVALLRETLGAVVEMERAVVGPDEFLEAPLCQEAIAAAEVIAALRSRNLDGLPDEARRWAGEMQLPSDEDLSLSARRAVEKVKADSELRELAEDSDCFEQWESEVDVLLERLH